MQQEVTETQKLSENNRINGQVKWFDKKKGFGFITYREQGKENDIFVHHTCIKYSDTQTFRNLIPGEYVEFEVVPCPCKEGQFQAEQVTGINGGLLLTEIKNNSRKMFSNKTLDK